MRYWLFIAINPLSIWEILYFFLKHWVVHSQLWNFYQQDIKINSRLKDVGIQLFMIKDLRLA